MATHTSAITVHASAQKVFDALTQPELVARWQFGRKLITTWEAGSAIRFRTEWDGNARVLEQWGTVLEVRANELVRYNLFTPRPGSEDRIENYCVTSYVLTEGDGPTKGQTQVELRQEDGRAHALGQAPLENILLSLKEVVEANYAHQAN